MKAIMMFDVEDVCKNCVLKHFLKCKGWEERHKECSWKPLPEKMRTDTDDIEENSYCQGWNECIEEMEK